MASLHESELELELEQALHEAESEGEGELELEGEGEGFLGAIGNVLGGLLGESELEGEGEFELEGEGEFELEGEGEFELENGEQFFGGIKRLIKRAAPMLKRVARFAVPMVAKAIGGPFGGIVACMYSNRSRAVRLRQVFRNVPPASGGASFRPDKSETWQLAQFA